MQERIPVRETVREEGEYSDWSILVDPGRFGSLRATPSTKRWRVA